MVTNVLWSVRKWYISDQLSREWERHLWPSIKRETFVTKYSERDICDQVLRARDMCDQVLRERDICDQVVREK